MPYSSGADTDTAPQPDTHQEKIPNMNKSRLATIAAALCLATASCIRQEPLNAECDILGVTLPDNELALSPEPDNNSVTLVVKNYVNVTGLAPEFTLTPGATIEPASGTVRDFSTPQTYTVTSQDGNWHKTYTVTARHNTSLKLDFSFELCRIITTAGGATYDEFYSVSEDPDTHETVTTVWASGNSGFALTNGKNPPDTYPTFQSDGGYEGNCACMVTRSTGTWGAIVDKPIAAGNLFIGRFDTNIAVAHPLQATKFGAPIMNVPARFTGFYRYSPGETYMQFDKDAPGKLRPIPGKKDRCNIYAVFYESTPDMEYLDGSNVLADDNPNILAVARLSEEQTLGAGEWTYFDLPFVFRSEADIDPDKLSAGKYRLAIVMTSSIDGDYFSGAIGSRLMVDEISIKCW